MDDIQKYILMESCNIFYKTAIEIAVHKQYIEIVKLLLANDPRNNSNK